MCDLDPLAILAQILKVGVNHPGSMCDAARILGHCRHLGERSAEQVQLWGHSVFSILSDAEPNPRFHFVQCQARMQCSRCGLHRGLIQPSHQFLPQFG